MSLVRDDVTMMTSSEMVLKPETFFSFFDPTFPQKMVALIYTRNIFWFSLIFAATFIGLSEFQNYWTTKYLTNTGVNNLIERMTMKYPNRCNFSFDSKIDHSSQDGVFALEQLGDGKETFGCLSGAQSLALHEEDKDFIRNFSNLIDNR